MKNKTYCVDCNKWAIPLKSYTGGFWCKGCFPKGLESWRNHNKARVSKGKYNNRLVRVD